MLDEHGDSIADGDASMDPSNILSGDGTGNLRVAKSKTLIRLMDASPKWTLVLAHCRMQMRIAICCGRCENPFLLKEVKYCETRAAYTQDWFAAGLKQTGMCYGDLESCEGLNSSN
jgi:hypothetical protein